ncbi:hypothetical protein MVLG_04619 [Microbotryum lychnidis-dioicae p1A1 Lamole]|uniref:Uncharacterized protein n=1 Tax=Microbotryum lychnidis-dioicae (strain p1A1 Lamole / MvSl-1064) TaxID=683840 RepID=U5HBS5_USTV1|nr:hypothetical protein MVLG_04619 [Microbotryum lychnidis-dioicae p1A1 Lamole]|eukprot:KDE04971.1 hypothetical protein MVLG_04619 [Microbotryum lychnidis-dioicae p1A1 Lamole]
MFPLPPLRNEVLQSATNNLIGLALTTPDAHQRASDRDLGRSTSTTKPTTTNSPLRQASTFPSRRQNDWIEHDSNPMKHTAVDDEPSLSFFSHMWRSLRDEASAFMSAASGTNTPSRVLTDLGSVEYENQEEVLDEASLRSKRPRMSPTRRVEEEVAEIEDQLHRHRNRPRPRGGVFIKDNSRSPRRTAGSQGGVHEGQAGTPSRRTTVRFAALPPSSTKPSQPGLESRTSHSPSLRASNSTEISPRKNRPHSRVEAILLGPIASELTRKGHEAKVHERRMTERERIKVLEARLKALEKENEQLRKSRELSKCLADQAVEMRTRSQSSTSRTPKKCCMSREAGGNAAIFCPLAAPRVDRPGVATEPKSPEIRSTSSAALTTLQQARASLRSTPGKRNHRIVTPSARSTPEHDHHILAAVATELESSLPSPGKQPTLSSPSQLSFPQVIRSAVKRKLIQANESHPNPLKDQICHLRYRVPPPSRPVIRLRPSFDSSLKTPRRPPRPAEGDLFSFDSTTTTVFGDRFLANKRHSGASSLQTACDGPVEDGATCEQTTAQIEFPEFTQTLLSVPEASESSTPSSGSQATLSTGTTSWDRIPDDLSSFTCDTAPLVSRFSFSDSSDLSSGTISHAKEYRSALLYRKVKGPSNFTTSFQQTRGTHQVNSVGDSLSPTFDPSAAALFLKGAKNPSPDSDRIFRLTTLLSDENLFMEPARHSAP